MNLEIIIKILENVFTTDQELKDFLIECCNFLKTKMPRLITTHSKSNKMSIVRPIKPIIDTTYIHEPKNGAFIIKAELAGKPIKASSLIAAFDLDYTLIKPKSGRKFPKDYEDWILLDDVKKKLNKLYDSGYKIVIFTNQAGSSFSIDEFTKKIKSISTLIDVPLQTFVATDYGYCRKPSVGMWWLLTLNNDEIDMKKSFYVGDAAGRSKDFSASDLKFALNLGLKFYTSVKMEMENNIIPIHPLEVAACFDKYLQDPIKQTDEQELILFVGPPASGKTSFAKKFPDYVIACQDDLKTKAKVISVVKAALKEGHSVIVDRKNEYKDDRNIFIELAKTYEVPVRIIWFDMPRDLSEHLCTYREIITGKHIPAIVFNKYYSATKGLELPTKEEGAEVIKVFFQKDIKEVDNPTIFTNYLV